MEFKEIDIPPKKNDKKKEMWDALADALKQTSKALEFPTTTGQGLAVAMRHRGVYVKVQRLTPETVAVWKVEAR
ncbi:MAG TPA: hypothetical protein VHV32_19260 [Candidatus Angelobacter sp.]|jgi:hypothetical protein|nr:hypothetical protein [Candidatus Angelobacter sp.]